MDKITITSADLNEPQNQTPNAVVVQKPLSATWRLLSFLLVLFPPLLFLAVILELITGKRRDLSTRQARLTHCCILLLVCCLVWGITGLLLARWIPELSLGRVKTPSELRINTFPQVPFASALSARDIARQLSPLVVVVHTADRRYGLQPHTQESGFGAGIIVLATRQGFLITTSRHVIDIISGKLGIGSLVGVTLKDGQKAPARVAGLHRLLDLALLWVNREPAESEFIQPLRGFQTIEVGEEVFVIGHPQGLRFSISSGIVAQVRGSDLIQISAPVSPGNSGGPVFDTRGRLLAIVQSTFDKTKNPNTENLNFAVRTDDLVKADMWRLSNEGKMAMKLMAAKHLYAGD